MKKHVHFTVLTFLCLFISITSFSQEPASNQFDYTAELARMTNIPNSPEAEAFGKYGNTSVSMYTGSPNIQVPIYTYQGREFNLPMSLSYDASGIKVEQLASNVGLGWNLNVGGRISRIVNGAPDDYSYTSSSKYQTIFNDEVRLKMLSYIDERVAFDDRQGVEDYFDFMHDINSGKYDTQPDYFSLNAIGINDYIAFDLGDETQQPQPYTLKNPRIKVNVTITIANEIPEWNVSNIAAWDITDEDGTQYFFEDAELTQMIGDGNGQGFTYGDNKKYNSSWVLTKIISANKKDTFKFNYTPYGPWTQYQGVVGASSQNDILDDTTPFSVPEIPDYSFSGNHTITQQFLVSIDHETYGVTNEIVKIDYENRYDIAASQALKTINIKNPHNGAPLKKFDFNYTYFGMNAADNPANEVASDIRLKLDSVNILNANDDLYQTYSFSYESPEDLPPVNSRSQDYLGYYNGALNSVLYPKLVFGAYTFDGADRDPVFNHAKKGILNKITYPTGGHSIFEYEPHSTPANPQDIEDSEYEVVKGFLSLVGGDTGVDINSEEATCGPGDNWCHDNYGLTQPEVAHKVFEIEESGNYTLTYIRAVANGIDGSTNGEAIGNTNTSFGVTAIVFKNETTNCIDTNAIELENIIDLQYSGGFSLDSELLVFDKNLHSVDINGERGVFLSAGCYQMTIVNPNSHETISLKVTGIEPGINTPAEYEEQVRAGIRVKSITDYTSENEIALVKEYKYKMQYSNTDSGVSSGVVLFNPTFFTLKYGIQQAGTDVNCEYRDSQTLQRYGVSNGGNRPHVAYKTVYEVFKHNNGSGKNGYLKHEFHTEGRAGLFSSGVPPNANSYFPNSKAGQEIQSTTFKSNNEPLSSNETEYRAAFGNAFFATQGMYVIYKPEKIYDILLSKPYDDNANTFTYDFVRWDTGVWGSPGSCAWYTPDLPSIYHQMHEMGRAPVYELKLSLAQGRVGNVKKTTSKQLFYKGADAPTEVVTQQEFSYNTSHLLREKKTVNSKGETIRQEFYYPEDFPDETVYQNMVSNNQLNVPVKTKMIKDLKFTVQQSEFEQISGGFYVSKVSTSKNSYILSQDGQQAPESTNNPLEPRIFYEYYSDGNIKSSYQYTASGSSTLENMSTYIWGYDKKYPIAKIDNASYSDVQSFIANLQSFSNLDNDRTIDLVNSDGSINYVGNEGDLREALGNLRNDSSLSNTMITTYTYDPMIGVTSITNPRGETIYYHYDDFHRLKHVKDKDGNILNTNTYNYRIQN